MIDFKVFNNCIFIVLVLYLIKICLILAIIYLVSDFIFELFYFVVENKRNYECCYNFSDG